MQPQLPEGFVVWPGWLGGVAVGLFLVLLLVVTGKVLGVSSAYGEVCGVGGSAYFRDAKRGFGERWRLFFVLGLPLGGAIAQLSGGGGWALSAEMGPLYDQVLPASLGLRALVLVLGGVFIGYGARLAGGCQSGHAIAGIALLNPASVLAGAGFFVGGILAVQALFAAFA